MTWFNVTESFPAFRQASFGPARWKAQAHEGNFGCTFHRCLFGVVWVFFNTWQTNSVLVKAWKHTTGFGEVRSILPPAKSIYSPNSSLPCHISGASSKSEGQSRGMNRARQPGHLSLPGDSPGGSKQLWGPQEPRLSLAGCVCSAALITEMWRNAVSQLANTSPGKRQLAAAEWAPVSSIPHLPPQIHSPVHGSTSSPNVPVPAQGSPSPGGC